jgi:hypothetical protein
MGRKSRERMMHGKAVAPPEETGPAFYAKPEPGSGKRRDTPEVVLQRVDRPQVDLTGLWEAAAGSDPAERELIRDLTEEIADQQRHARLHRNGRAGQQT